MKWGNASDIISDRLKPKGTFFHTATRPAMLYGTKCWVVKCLQEHKLSVVEMRMLKHNGIEKIKNECIREKVGLGVATIGENMVKSHLSGFGGFGHIRR